MTDQNRNFSNLNPIDRAVVSLSFRPVTVVVLAVSGASLIGWIYLIAMVSFASHHQGTDALGPGMFLVAPLTAGIYQFDYGSLPTFLSFFWDGAIRFHYGAPDVLLVLMMWLMMSLAMMLPTAAPMLVTYGDIAETARAKGEATASTFILAGGYLAVWVGFSLIATVAQGLMNSLFLVDDFMRPVGEGISILILLIAGLYQFSSLKRACLRKCQRPFSFLFGRWSSKPSVIFGLGIEQGIACLGCCWALMAVMFVVGMVNLVWIAILSLVMLSEKIIVAPIISQIIGVLLIFSSLALLTSKLIPFIA